MAALDTLAAYHVEKARSDKNKDLKKEHFSKVHMSRVVLVGLSVICLHIILYKIKDNAVELINLFIFPEHV